MEGYKELENKILQTSQGKFEEAVHLIIDGEYNNPATHIHLGGAIKTDKTRYGTPDDFFKLPNGEFVFVEITTQTNGLKTKIEKDIEKCKEKAIKNQIKVNKIIYACTGKIDSKDVVEFETLAKSFCSNTNSFEFWGIDKITTQLFSRYLTVARDCFGQKFSYGTFKNLDEYFTFNKFDVSQNHEFLFRQELVNDSIENIKNHNILIFHGKAGCGKTKLALECAKLLKEKHNFSEAYVVNSSLDKTMEDLQLVNNGENILFILDDVNRMPYLKDFIAYSEKYKNIFLIATVRDYAINKVQENLILYNYNKYIKYVEVKNLNREEQESIIKKIYPNIRYELLTQINNISKGNLRFAIMCVTTLKNNNLKEIDLKKVLSDHFNVIKSDLDLDIKKDKKYKTALILISLLFRIVLLTDQNSQQEFKEILKNLGLEYGDFLDAMEYWNQKQIINTSFNGIVFEIADQILANYLFYQFVFEEKIVDLKRLFSILFPKFRDKFVEMFKSIIPIYGYDETVIQSELDKVWNDLYQTKNDSGTLGFLQAFQALFPEKALEFITKKIDSDLSEDYIRLLYAYESSNYSKLAINKLLKIFEDNSELFEKERKEFVSAFSIHLYSYDFKLSSQIYLLETVSNNFNKNVFYKKVFLDLSKELLKFTFSTSSFENKMSMVYHTLTIVPCEEVFKMRSLIWEGLFQLYSDGYEIKTIYEIVSSNKRNLTFTKKDSQYEIITKDSSVINCLLLKNKLNLSKFENKVFILILCQCAYLPSSNEYKKIIEPLRTDDVFNLFYNLHIPKDLDYMYSEEQDNILNKAFSKIKNKDTFKLYLLNTFFLQLNNWQLNNVINGYFNYIDVHNSQDYTKIFVDTLIILGNIDLSPSGIILSAKKYFQTNELIQIILNSKLKNEDAWLLNIFLEMKIDEINNEIYNLCVNTIKSKFVKPISSRYGNERLSNLLQFEKYKHGFVKDFFQFVKDYKEKDKPFVLGFIADFYYQDKNGLWTFKNIDMEDIKNMFSEDLYGLYYETYFDILGTNADLHSDDFINYLAEIDDNYIYRYFNDGICSNNRFIKYEVLNNKSNKIDIVLNIVKNQKYKDFGMYHRYEIQRLMLEVFDDEEYKIFIDKFIKQNKDSHTDMFEMGCIISDFKKEWKFIFAELLIKNEVTPDNYIQIPVLTSKTSWSGSQVVIIQEAIDQINEFIKRLTTDKELVYKNIFIDQKTRLKESIKTVQLRELKEGMLE